MAWPRSYKYMYGEYIVSYAIGIASYCIVYSYV